MLCWPLIFHSPLRLRSVLVSPYEASTSRIGFRTSRTKLIQYDLRNNNLLSIQAIRAAINQELATAIVQPLEFSVKFYHFKTFRLFASMLASISPNMWNVSHT